jgi:hypothetical protein
MNGEAGCISMVVTLTELDRNADNANSIAVKLETFLDLGDPLPASLMNERANVLVYRLSVAPGKRPVNVIINSNLHSTWPLSDDVASTAAHEARSEREVCSDLASIAT